MFPEFSRTLRQLDADRGQGAGWMMGLGAGVLVAWALWGFWGELPREVQSVQARVEAVGTALPLQLRASGTVASVHGKLGERVKAGDLLLQMDDTPLRLSLAEAQARRTAVAARLRVGEQSSATEVRASEAEIQVAAGSQAELRAALVALEERRSRLLSDRAGSQRLVEQGALERREVDAIDSELSQIAGEELKLRESLRRAEAGTTAASRGAEQRALGGQASAADLAADLAAAEAAVARLEQQIVDSRVLAPADGILGEWSGVAPGAYLGAGERFGALVPDGPLQVVAWFPPTTSVGQVATTQPAVVRLDGFPQTRLRGLPATVARVGSGAESAGLRVELSLDGPPPLPLSHGMVATVEVEVERLSPFSLLWRLVQG
ncbi:MAG TPA: HlyD family efflux transporter periplasmic adaptor subunit [Myxococcota bacterium]|nr:HlyD family efflux transporter periplasmic adaptor subunit [Myxococcota bacterium]